MRNLILGRFLQLLVVSVCALSFGVVLLAHAQEAPRLEQLTKDARSGVGINSRWSHNLQRIACADVSGHILDMTLSLEGGGSGYAQAGVYGSGDPATIDGNNTIPPTYTTDIVFVPPGKNDITFSFATPVDLSYICPNPGGYFYLAMKSVSGGFYRYGSNSPTAYRDAFYGSVSSSFDPGPADWYFIINGVAEVNHAPSLNLIASSTVNEGSHMFFSPSAHDLDGGNLVITAGTLPAGATFSGGVFQWTPRFDQGGTYEVNFMVYDDGNQGLFPVLMDSSTTTIMVVETTPILNRLEQLTKDARSGVGINSRWSHNLQRIACADVSGHILDMTLSLEGGGSGYAQAGVYGSGDPATIDGNNTIPPTYTTDIVFVPPGKNDITFSFATPVDLSYICPNPGGYFYLAMKSVSGGFYRYGSNSPTAYRDAFYGSVSSSFDPGPADWYFIVNPSAVTNQPPILNSIGSKIIDENTQLQFTVSASDPDAGSTITLSASNLPSGATFDPQTGIFSWTPTFNQAGSYLNTTFTATDNGNPVMSASESIAITVNNVNRAPVLTLIGNKSVNEGQTLIFTLSASDPDNDTLTYSATNLPAGATFDATTRTFSWTPSYSQAGNYANVEFTVMDNGTPMMLAFEDVTITVGNVNRAPIFAPLGSQQVLEHNLLTFTVSATDPDGDAVTLSASGMPSGATFNPATGVFSWTPVYPQAGVYTPTFTATDNGSPSASAMMDVVITVGSNPTPTEQSQTLVTAVVSVNLPSAITNSYLANLNKVGTFIEQGKVQQAINQLSAFIQKVNQDYAQGKITLAEKNDFVSLAQNLINVLQ